MVREDRAAWKAQYFAKVTSILDQYNKVFVVGIDNVRSNQMQEIRKKLRGQCEVLMGKNTLMKKAIRGYAQSKNADVERLLPCIVQNVGLVFTNEECCDIKDKILENRVQAPAKAGAIAPLDVVVPAQNTGLGPEKTSFFQALQIPTKITRGTIEILNDQQLITTGDKVGASEATLLNMLKIYPFTYGLVILRVYDNGTIYNPDVLDITNDDVLRLFSSGVADVAALSLEMNYPNMASVPHMIANSFKDLLAVAAVTDVTFKEAEQVKEYLADPSKFAAAAAPTAAAAPAAKKEEVKVEEEESDDDMGLDLFG